MRYTKTKVEASIWKRFLALVIDLLIINLFLVLPFRKTFAQMIPNTISFTQAMSYLESNQALADQLWLIILLISILAWIYFTFTEWKLGATAGDLLMRLKVVNESGKEISFWQACFRNLFVFSFFPLFLLWLIDPLYLLLKQKRLTEVITKTDTIEEIVVDKSKIFEE